MSLIRTAKGIEMLCQVLGFSTDQQKNLVDRNNSAALYVLSI
jgi:hypothetical protein